MRKKWQMTSQKQVQKLQVNKYKNYNQIKHLFPTIYMDQEMPSEV